MHKRNPTFSHIEIWTKLKHGGVELSGSTVLRIIQRTGNFIPYKPAKKKYDQIYNTPITIHEKWQIDVKFVPKCCKNGCLEGSYYQYTILEESTRKRFLYFTNEHSMYETVKALELAIKFFKHFPKELQSDNGFEFSDKARRKPNGKRTRSYDNILERFLKKHNIKHHFIRPRTPQHNEKVERSHRTDQDKFYSHLSFYSLEDLRKQGRAWNKR